MTSLVSDVAQHDVHSLQQSLQSVNSPGDTNAATSDSPRADQSADTSVSASLPQFSSALSYTTVRDFAYPEFHPLHYGVAKRHSGLDSDTSFDDDEEDDQLDDYGGESKEESENPHEEVWGRAVALFDFEAENDNEVGLKEGQIIWISYRHGQGWLVAEDADTGMSGLVPEEYVQLIGSDYENETEIYQSPEPESDSEGWVETDDSTDLTKSMDKLSVDHQTS